MVTMLQPLSHTCGRDSLFSSRILHPNKERLHLGVVFHYVIKEKFHNYRTKFLDSMYRYDEDYNHEPCQRSGHRAHWAVASGKTG